MLCLKLTNTQYLVFSPLTKIYFGSIIILETKIFKIQEKEVIKLDVIHKKKKRITIGVVMRSLTERYMHIYLTIVFSVPYSFCESNYFLNYKITNNCWLSAER